MLFTEEIRKAVSICMDNYIPFVVFAYPSHDSIIFFSEPAGVNECRTDNRFIVSGWCGGTNDEYVIRDKADAFQIIHMAHNHSDNSARIPSPWGNTTEKSEYNASLDPAIDYLCEYGGKVVISRTISGDSTNTDWVEVAERYFSLHSEAFRYLYFTPRHGFWLGASPELLLKVEGKSFKTMALAGTRNVSQSAESWSPKNIAEQAVVRNYIVDKLYDVGLNPICGPTETVTTGNIQHLSTVITGEIATCTSREILRALNPTPALAGYPLAAALEQIVRLEKHPRKCYGGYIAVEGDDCISAYVNLRNVNFDKERWCMYVGSGIMPDSDIEDEWKETEAKSLILKHLIEDSQK